MFTRSLRTGIVFISMGAVAVFGLATPALAEAPGAVQNLRAISQENPIDPSQPLVKLRWQVPTTGGAVKVYRVFVDGVLVETTRSTEANVTGPRLIKGVKYTFGVQAVSASGASKQVEVVKRAVTTPSEPLNLQAIPGDGILKLSWDAPLDTGGGPIKQYRVIASSFLPGREPTCTPAPVTGTSCVIKGLRNGVTYDVTVLALNAALNELPGLESAPAIGIPNFSPSGPREFRVLAGGSTTATLAWQAPETIGGEAILGYTISLFNNEGFRFPNQAPEYPQVNVGPDARRYRLTGLTPGLPYQFGIQAYTATSPGAMTVNVMHDPIGLPSKPAVVTVTGVGNTTVNLEWEDGDPSGGLESTHYRLTATPVDPPAGVLTEEIVCPVKATNDAPDFECAATYLWMRLVNGVTYSFTVAAKNKFGWGPTSNYPATATPEGPPPPPLVSAATITSPTSITLAWDPSVTAGGPDVGAVTYTVTLNDEPVCRDIAVTTCVLTGLTEGDDYTVKVMAINEVFGGDQFSTSEIIVNTNPIQVGTP